MQLREYQEEDVKKLMTLPAMGVFNEQRTGKTPTSIVTMQRKGVQRLLIVCPASLVYKWADEYAQWTGNMCAVITSASEYIKRNMVIEFPAVVINYENLRNNGKYAGAWEQLLKTYKPDGLIVDEAHRCKDRTSKNFYAVKQFRKVPNRLYLTGTPAPNKPWDVWSLLHLIKPDSFTSYWNFIHEYFTEETIWVGDRSIVQPSAFKEGMDVLLQKNLEVLSVMRKRKDVMPWLPPEEAPTQIKLPCTPAQRKYINELETVFETEHVNTQSVLEQLIRIRQICAAPAILNLKGTSPKLDWLEQYIVDYPDKSIIVFSNSKKFIYEIYKRFGNQTGNKLGVVTGDTLSEERQKRINLFQQGAIKVLVIQTQAGKEGLTLDRADVTIFLDTYPPAADYLQAKDRMVPTSPERVKPQEIIHLMMKDTYDEQLYKLVQQGIDETDLINDYIKHLKERR